MVPRSFLLYATVFATNAAILILEVAGGRLLAPYLGTSVHVWAGLIAIILGAMALGLHVGGRYFAKRVSTEHIALTVALGAGCGVISWGMRDVVPSLIASPEVPLTVGALAIGALLFLPAVAVLSAISPGIAQLLIRDVKDASTIVGTLSAVGTTGSIFGAVFTGLVLIPSFGLHVLLLITPLSLFIVALFLAPKKYLTIGTLALLSIVSATLMTLLPTKADGYVAERTTAYNRIVIKDEQFAGRSARTLWTSPFGIQCLMYLDAEGVPDDNELAAPYQQAHVVAMHALFADSPQRGVFLGGCNLSFPRFLLHADPTMQATVVEIDPGIVDAASTFFNFESELFPTLRVVTEDARIFMNHVHESYDFIHFDAYGSGSRVPFHLVTKEMFTGMYQNLSDDGILIMNVHGAPDGNGALLPTAITNTAQTVFPHVALYTFIDAPLEAQNMVLIASKNKTLPETIAGIQYPNITLREIPLRSDTIVLTDTYAPIEGLWRRLIATP